MFRRRSFYPAHAPRNAGRVGVLEWCADQPKVTPIWRRPTVYSCPLAPAGRQPGWHTHTLRGQCACSPPPPGARRRVEARAPTHLGPWSPIPGRAEPELVRVGVGRGRERERSARSRLPGCVGWADPYSSPLHTDPSHPAIQARSRSRRDRDREEAGVAIVFFAAGRQRESVSSPASGLWSLLLFFFFLLLSLRCWLRVRLAHPSTAHSCR